MLESGLYEQVINKKTTIVLSELTNQQVEIQDIDSAEATKILAGYVTSVVEEGLESLLDHGGDLSTQIALINRIISTIVEDTSENDLDSFKVTEPGQQLLALLNTQNTALSVNKKAVFPRPSTSIAQSSLFTGAIHEPQMFSELKKEILSATAIDMLVFFIKWSGLRLILDELTIFTQNGGSLRIITTSYMGATDVKAVKELGRLPNTTIKLIKI